MQKLSTMENASSLCCPPSPTVSSMEPDSIKKRFAAEVETRTSCNVKLFKEGETVFTEGSYSDTAYIIESGLIEIFVGIGEDAVQLSVLGPGDIFGEMGLIDSFPRSASARALSHCRCIVISAAQIAERIEASNPLVRLLISISLHRNRAYNNYFKSVLNSSQVVLPSPSVSEKAYIKNKQHKKILDEIKLESDLQSAVRNNELQTYYQPLFNINDNAIVGFESLLRWRCPERGMVSPQQFISLAEETSLIVPIGDWILERACLDLKRFQQHWVQVGNKSTDLFMSVNISVRQFQEADFFEKLTALTQLHNVQPHHIKLEVTERIFLAEAEAIEAIDKCRAAGFEVALDDFGTGYSSLNYLERCEIDSLKIDQSFTQKICTSERAKIIVSSIIDIAKKMGLPTVAEGIESPEQQLILQEMGCDIGQGFLFSRPLPVLEILRLLG